MGRGPVQYETPPRRSMGMREVMVVSPFHQSQKETEAQDDAYKNKL